MKPSEDLIRAKSDKGNDKLPSSARWATEADLDDPAFAYREGQIILGQYRGENGDRLIGFGGSHRSQDDRHIVTIAGARSGKGLTCIRPNLATYLGSMLVIDPKGEHAAFELEHGHRQKLGQKIAILDPFNVVGGKQSFNPFSDLAALDSFSLFDKLALFGEALIIPEGKEPHWTNGAKNLLRFFIIWMIATPEYVLPSLARLRTLIMGAEAPLRSMSDENKDSIFEQALDKATATNNEELGLMASMFATANEKEVGYFISTLQNQLSFLSEIAPKSMTTDFNLSELKNSAITIYLVLPASKIPSHFRWLRLMLMLAVAEMEKGETPARDVVFLLEEFAALGHLEIIEKAAGLMPGFGLKLWVILQDLTQLQKHYRESWETFLDNAGAIQAFGNDGGTTTEYLSKLLGEKLYKVHEDANLGSQGLAGAGHTSIERREWKPLLPSFKIGQTFSRDAKGLPMLLLRKGFNPAKINRLPYSWNT